MPDCTPQRAVLYVPASNQRAVEKSVTIDADWIIFDLEDSVAVEEKSSARETLAAVFKLPEINARQAAIRCNAVGSDAFVADINSIAVCQPQAVLIPKVESVEEVQHFCECAASAGVAESINTWFMIETSKGILHLGEILKSAASINWQLTTLVVGHNDIASETGVSLAGDRQYMVPWLMQIVLQAKAHDLQVLDSVWNNFRDLTGFEKEAAQGKQMGFDGKTLIHPSQVEIATRVFSPTADEVARATLIVEAFLKSENQQKNVVNVDGEMVERLHLWQAERLLARSGI